MKVKPFGLAPAVAMIILSVGLVNHVLIVPLLLSAAHRDAWLSVFLALTVIVPWTAIPLFALLKRIGRMRFDEWLLRRTPSFVAYPILYWFLATVLLIAMETLVVTSSWTKTTYLPRTPVWVVIFVFLGLCLYAVHKGLRTIAYTSCLLLPAVVLLGDFVMTANMPHKDYRYLLPLLEHGFSPVVLASLNCFTAFTELFMFLFIAHHMHGSIKRWQLVALIIFLGLLTFGPLTGALSQFGPEEAGKMRYPAFSQWRLVSIGQYFEHVDFFAIFQWLSGALIRLSLAIYIVVEYSPIAAMKRQWIGISALALFLFVQAMYWNKNMLHYGKLAGGYFQYIGIVNLILIVIVYAATFRKKGGDVVGGQSDS